MRNVVSRVICYFLKQTIQDFTNVRSLTKTLPLSFIECVLDKSYDLLSELLFYKLSSYGV